MKLLLLLITLLSQPLQAQNYPVGSPAEWMTDRAPIKVMLISAPWCTYCRETRTIFAESQALRTLTGEHVSFFEFEEQWREPFEFEGEIFSFYPSGPDQGRHEFVSYILQQSGQESFPLFVVWTEKEQRWQIYSGMLSESDWISGLGAILNQRALPDSVSNN